jgi:type II restriction/modification system DNA methylase subunit YeeA
VEAYNVLKAIYEERGYRTRDIPQLILENNLFGLDIDDRAAQLAGFALLMKAREDDRRILTRNVRLNVLAMQSSQHLDASTLWRDLNLTGDWHQGQSQSLFEREQQDLSNNYATYKLIAELIERFQDAKTFGSLIEVPNGWEAPLKALLKELIELNNSGDMMQKATAQRLIPIVQQAWILAQRYEAVVANPPYMSSKGMNKSLKDYARKVYPNSKSDLFAIFMEHAFSLLAPLGYNAQITMQSWMFISNYEKMRAWLLQSTTIVTMAHFGSRAFGQISGEIVQTVAWVLSKQHMSHYKPTFFRLIEGDEEDKRKSLLDRINRFDNTLQDDLKKIPSCPIVYWVSDKLRQIFEDGTPLGKIVDVKEGLGTRDDARFLRLWHEVAHNRIGFGCRDRNAAKNSKKRWFPCNKGGALRKWSGNQEHVVNWESDGEKIKSFRDNDGVLKSRPQNQNYYFKPSLSWSSISSGFTSFRKYDAGHINNDQSMSAFCIGKFDFETVVAFCNSSITRIYAHLLNPTLKFGVGDFVKLPFKQSFDSTLIDRANHNVTRLVHISSVDWNAGERSWGFQSLPILSSSSRSILTLESSYSTWHVNSLDNITEMKCLEEENNRLFIDAYGLEDELSSEVLPEEITLTCNPHYRYGGNRSEEELESLLQCDTLKELVSYAIGCMMGRYSLDKPGLILASQGETVRDYLAQIPEPSFAPDDNAIIPLTDQEWFPDDATNRFRDFVRTVWGEEHLQENLDFVAESLCLHAIKPKKGEAALETIRRYLSTQFYKDHLRTYKKRPIYWLFSSGKQKAFECLVYLHRYNESTLAEMRTDYVIPLTTKLASYVEKLEQDKDASTSAADTKRIEKELSKLYKQQAELNTFDEKLRHYADQRITLDLDDGVKVNYGKFGDLLADVKVVVGK